MGTVLHPQGCLEERSRQNKYWKGTHGVGEAPGEIFRTRAAKPRTECFPKTDVSASHSPKSHFHKDILTALSRNWNVSVGKSVC